MHTIVIKVGTQVITDNHGALDHSILAQLVTQIGSLMRSGYAVTLVSSGAVAAGRALLPKPATRLDEVSQRQVFSALGQVALMGAYGQRFAALDIPCAQILATRSDFRDRQHYLNMHRCLDGLLAQGIVPIVNENDSVAVTELMFTDNDELAGLVAAMLDARALFLLSDIDGVYDDDAGRRVVRRWPAQGHLAIASAGPSRFGRGGIQTKIRMAERSASLGIETWIANGRRNDIVSALLAGQQLGTRFAPQRRTRSSKRWVAAGGGHAKGCVTINQGALAALRDGKRPSSLLPIGVVAVDGAFQKGDIVRIECDQGLHVGFGRAQYGAEAARSHLGTRGKRALIHYDYLFIEQ